LSVLRRHRRAQTGIPFFYGRLGKKRAPFRRYGFVEDDDTVEIGFLVSSLTGGRRGSTGRVVSWHRRDAFPSTLLDGNSAGGAERLEVVGHANEGKGCPHEAVVVGPTEEAAEIGE